MPHTLSRRRALALLLGGVACAPAAAREVYRPRARFSSDTAAAPSLKTGDQWTYAHVWERSHTIPRPQRTEISVALDPARGWFATRRESDSGKSATWGIGQDWSRWTGTGRARQDVDRPLHFPLWPGKTWDVERWLPDPDTMGYEREGVHQHCTVAGWEDITTPAGRFFAARIEVEGRWQAAPPAGSVGPGPKDSQPQPDTLSPKTLWDAPLPLYGQLTRTLWYAPEAKRWVRQVEIYYDANGALLESHKAELQSYRVTY